MAPARGAATCVFIGGRRAVGMRTGGRVLVVLWCGQRHEGGRLSVATSVCRGNVTPEIASVFTCLSTTPHHHHVFHARSQPLPASLPPRLHFTGARRPGTFFFAASTRVPRQTRPHHHAASTKTSLRLPPPSLPVLGAAAPTAKPRRCPLLHRGAAGTCTWGLGCGMLSD